MEALIHAANLLRLCSFFQNDTVRLKLLTAVATLCLVAYFATRAEPLLTVIAWNAFFAAVNFAQAGFELTRRRGLDRSTGVREDGGTLGDAG